MKNCSINIFIQKVSVCLMCMTDTWSNVMDDWQWTANNTEKLYCSKRMYSKSDRWTERQILKKKSLIKPS